MNSIRFNLDEAKKKQLNIVLYLVLSGLVGYALAWLVGKPELTAIFAPALNYIAYQLKLELENQGITQIVRELRK